jgi:hypothetical protein
MAGSALKGWKAPGAAAGRRWHRSADRH